MCKIFFYLFQFILTVRKGGQTIYQKVLTGMRTGKSLKTWEWGFPLNQATYHALFPRAWCVYDIPDLGVKLTCVQISPLIPHDYKVSSYAYHYENMPMQYTEIFSVVKNETFIRKKKKFSYFCSKHRLWVHVRTPRRGSSNKYP